MSWAGKEGGECSRSKGGQKEGDEVAVFGLGESWNSLEKTSLPGNQNTFKCSVITTALPLFPPPLGQFHKPYNIHLNLQLLRDTTRRWERFD